MLGNCEPCCLSTLCAFVYHFKGTGTFSGPNVKIPSSDQLNASVDCIQQQEDNAKIGDFPKPPMSIVASWVISKEFSYHPF